MNSIQPIIGCEFDRIAFGGESLSNVVFPLRLVRLSNQAYSPFCPTSKDEPRARWER